MPIRIQRLLKRIIDLLVTSVALIILLPLLLLIVLIIKVSSSGPAFFTQIRAGKNGYPFTIYKFRTMSDARDVHGRLLADSARITHTGRFLRSTSIDELPQLWNVIKGEMSLIGPRPLPTAYLTRYTVEQQRRHDVLPGIAGYAAIKGRSHQSWDSILAHDVWYVDHWSLGLDAYILYKVLFVVIKREGVEASAEGNIPEFLGVLAGTQKAQNNEDQT